jgi:hypothetical protein
MRADRLQAQNLAYHDSVPGSAVGLAVMTGRDLIPTLTGDQFLEAAIFRDGLLHCCSTTDSVYAVLKIVKDNFGRASSDDLLETTDYRNNTPLMAAIRAGRPDVATFIIDQFAERGNSNTPMPLDIAVESGNPDCVRACVRKRPTEDTTILDPQFYFITSDPSRHFFETAISQGAGMLRALVHVKDEVPGIPGLANGSHLMNDAKNAEEYHYAARLSHLDSLAESHRCFGVTYPGQPSVHVAWTDALPLVMEFDLSFSNIQSDDHICPILTLELPVRMFDELHSLQCNGHWVDQGHGNQKGQLGCAYIHHASNLFEKLAAHTPEGSRVNTADGTRYATTEEHIAAVRSRLAGRGKTDDEADGNVDAQVENIVNIFSTQIQSLKHELAQRDLRIRDMAAASEDAAAAAALNRGSLLSQGSQDEDGEDLTLKRLEQEVLRKDRALIAQAQRKRAQDLRLLAAEDAAFEVRAVQLLGFTPQSAARVVPRVRDWVHNVRERLRDVTTSTCRLPVAVRARRLQTHRPQTRLLPVRARAAPRTRPRVIKASDTRSAASG